MPITVNNKLRNALLSPIKQEIHVKLEFFDSHMTYLGEFSKQVTKSDLGSINVSLGRAIRRTFNFTLNNITNEFDWGEDKLIWLDKRVKVYVGLKVRDGSIEYAPQGVFLMTELSDSHDLSGKRTQISGMDKAFIYTDKRGKFYNETTIVQGALVSAAIKTILEGETLFNFDDVTVTLPREFTYSPSDNRWQAAEELAKLAQCDLFYDVDGFLRLRKINFEDFDSQPITWIYKYNDPIERFYAGNIRKLDENILANHIRVIGGSSQTPSVMYDLVVDDALPLWANSPYSIQNIGRILYFHNNGNPDGLLTTTDECKWRAKYELMKRLGYTERVSLTIAPNFTHDVGDVIEIIDNENSVSGKYLLESFQLPLYPQLMQCECIKYRKVIDNWDFI